VVRIEPKSGRDKPSIAFSEFDGLTRIIFSRRNKTIRASFFGSKETLGMIERNYRTWASLNSLPLEDGYLDDNGETEADEEMADGDEDPQDDEDQEEGLGMDLDGDDVPDFFKELTSAGQGEGQSVVRTPSRRRKTKVGELVRKKVAMVLEVTGLAESRASKCDEGDFLKLLYEFNKEGIHFA
jgi:18S rRNA (adenine1779-N6/adenine1780-N6)-dimethyltransferase